MTILGLSSETILIAFFAAVFGFLFRDLPKMLINWWRGRNREAEEWYESSRKYLKQLSQLGAQIQSSSEIDTDKLQKISELSEDFPAEVTPCPSGVDEDLYTEVESIAYYSGMLPEVLKDMENADTISSLLRVLLDFRKRMDMENVSMEELYDKSPNRDQDIIHSRMLSTFRQSGLSIEDQFNIATRMFEEFDVENMEDTTNFQFGDLTLEDFDQLDWEYIFEPLSQVQHRRIVSGLRRDMVGAFLIEIPEEAIEMIDQAR